jgi:hypothetical protein
MPNIQDMIGQIIDDMPTKGHYFGRFNVVTQPHPDIEQRMMPTDQASALASELCHVFDSKTLPIDAKVSSHYGAFMPKKWDNPH